ncbi:MAG: transposase [Saccharofermentanales bacterium]
MQNFSSPDKLQAFAGLDPSTYQSGKFKADKTPMVKHGSTYLRWALMQAARLAALNCETFRRYLELKRAKGNTTLLPLAIQLKNSYASYFTF